MLADHYSEEFLNGYEKISQEREMDRFVFTAIGTDKIRMDIWLKGCPEPSVVLNLDIRDAETIRRCLDSVLSNGPGKNDG